MPVAVAEGDQTPVAEADLSGIDAAVNTPLPDTPSPELTLDLNDGTAGEPDGYEPLGGELGESGESEPEWVCPDGEQPQLVEFGDEAALLCSDGGPPERSVVGGKTVETKRWPKGKRREEVGYSWCTIF